MPLILIERPDDERLAWYRGVGDPELLRRGGRFVAEGRLVVGRLLRSTRFETESVLVTPAALERLRDVIAPRLDRLPVHVVALETLVHLTGFNMHRGALAIGRRPRVDSRGLEELAATGDLLVVLEGLANADNVGGVFRSALAFGASGVVLDPTTCDPLYRKAVRTSMAAALEVPFVRAVDWPGALRVLGAAGVALLALSPGVGAIDIDEAPEVLRRPRIALLIGNEGTGLSAAALDMANARLRIPIVPGVDSLNAATAAGIALYLASRARAG
jgi:tRNA G18 (ribose-2'-O)-methylase SpoU